MGRGEEVAGGDFKIFKTSCATTQWLTGPLSAYHFASSQLLSVSSKMTSTLASSASSSSNKGPECIGWIMTVSSHPSLEVPCLCTA